MNTTKSRVSDGLINENPGKSAFNRNLAIFVLYTAIISVLSLVYNYPETLLKRPQSIHNWRQCDGASLALNYYQEGMHFFHPQTHMLYSDDYTSGYSAPSEIPVLYYFVAILYKIFGYHEYIFRAVNLLIFYIGLFYLFKLADLILHDIFYATVVTVLIFSAPVLVYYANNFMPNTVALSFSFIGWYYFYKYYLEKKTGVYLLSVLFLGIASALKITELTGPIIILGLMIADRLKIVRLNLATDHRFILKSGSLLLVFLVVFAWVFYARHYNSLHGSVQFMTYTIPVWKMDRANIDQILHLINVLWFKEYFYSPTFWFMAGTVLILVLWWKRSHILLRLVCIAEIAALLAFSMLWFQGLGDHDYFYISFYLAPALLFINFFFVIKSLGFSKINALVIRFVFMVVIILNVYYARERHSLRYYRSWMNDYEQQKDLYTVTPWLKETGISKNDTVVFYPAHYIRPLYLMNVKGWAIHEHDTVTPELIDRDSSQLSLYALRGAEYFITNDLKSAEAYKPFRPYMQDLYAQYKSIFIFKLKGRE